MSELGSILEYQEDLSSAEAPKALPANEYPGEIVGTAMHENQNTGKRSVKVTWRVRPEDFPADYTDADQFPEGKEVDQYVGAGTDKASMFRMRKFVEAIGAKAGKKIDINDWVGKKASLELIPDEFEGVERERIRSVKAG